MISQSTMPKKNPVGFLGFPGEKKDGWLLLSVTGVMCGGRSAIVLRSSWWSSDLTKRCPDGPLR